MVYEFSCFEHVTAVPCGFRQPVRELSLVFSELMGSASDLFIGGLQHIIGDITAQQLVDHSWPSEFPVGVRVTDPWEDSDL